MGSSHMSSDGRVIAKTPPALLSSEDTSQHSSALHTQIQQLLGIELQTVVKGQILPALKQILSEHRVSQNFMMALCNHSPIVPADRIQLLSFALWLGFEHDFGNSIHLLCPQVEHIVRVQLKEAGAQTTNINRDGIENENGLSTLMDLPEATEILGEDLVYEIKSIFTDVLGANLRNEVAHGLLNDNNSSSVNTIYAWWMVTRMVIDSVIKGSPTKEEESQSVSIDTYWYFDTIEISQGYQGIAEKQHENYTTKIYGSISHDRQKAIEETQKLIERIDRKEKENHS